MLARLEGRPGGATWLAVAGRLQLALKCALAAACAWVAAEAVTHALHVQGLGNYVYYAPLGAVFATDATVAGSARIAGKSAAALALGAALGLAVATLVETSVLSLALAVGIGVFASSLPFFGDQRGLVPVVALFVLVIGGEGATTYAAAYVGLTALGAVCGVVVNLLLPALPLARSRATIERLRAALAAQVEELAEGLRQEPPGLQETTSTRRADTEDALEATRRAVANLLEAERANHRGLRYRQRLGQQRGVAYSLERVYRLVDDLLTLLSQSQGSGAGWSPLDPELAEVIAVALDELAALVRAFDETLTEEDPRLHGIDEAVQTLVEEFGRRRDLDAADVAQLGAVVATVRRSTAALHPGHS